MILRKKLLKLGTGELNMNETNRKGLDVLNSLGLILTVIFSALRACEVIGWGWFWVLFPYMVCEFIVIMSYAIKGVKNDKNG